MMEENHTLLQEWYQSYSDGLFKYIVGMARDVQQAEDIMQDTFVRTHQYLARHTRIEHPKSFLYHTAHNLTIDYFRKKAPVYRVRSFFNRQRDPGPSVESILEAREKVERLCQALARIKPVYREVILLRKVEGFSVKETAQILNCSESKIKSTQMRAIRALKKEMERVQDR